MNCKECESNNRCQKPYESEAEYQRMYLGRTYTEEEWEREGVCAYFNPKKSNNIQQKLIKKEESI